MLDRITAQLIADAQAERPEAFTLNDAADIIVDKAEQVTAMGAPTDVFDLAVATTKVLDLPESQTLGIIQSALRKQSGER
jgi:hypothetical protein